jgi:thiol-disulfide isomerase/thioredoxin
MKALSLLTLLAVSGLAVFPALAQKNVEAEKPVVAAEPSTLVVGDMAPPLAVESFVKGTPIKAMEKGKVYVVEFWATWCGPCRKAFPHLSKLQEQYKDKVTFVGVNVWEDQEYTPETIEKVKKFVEGQGEKMGYTVAYDGAAGKMRTTYMEAAGQDGIPASFIVNQDGRVAWIGNPLDSSFDSQIEAVVNKTLTIDSSTATKAREDLKKRAQARPLMEEFSKQMRAGDTDAAMEIVDKVVALGGEYGQQAAQFKFGYLLQNKGSKEAVAFGKTAYEASAKDSPMLLNQFAWTIVDPNGGVADKDLDFALMCANRAAELTKEKDGAILDTLARVHWTKGDKAKALEIQKKAVAIATAEFKEDLEATLKEYEGK